MHNKKNRHQLVFWTRLAQQYAMMYLRKSKGFDRAHWYAMAVNHNPQGIITVYRNWECGDTLNSYCFAWSSSVEYITTGQMRDLLRVARYRLPGACTCIR